MAIHAPSRTRVSFAVAVLSAVCAFHAVVHAASPVPYGIKGGIFYYDWLMVYGGIFPTFPDAEHGKTWLTPWDFKVVKESAGEVTVSMSLKDDFDYSAAPRRFRGSTGIEATYHFTL